MIRISKTISLLLHEILEVEVGDTLGSLSKFTKRIDVEKGTTINKVELTVSASQTYLSGAEIQISMNGKVLRPFLRWNAFENGGVQEIYDVTPELLSGTNTFSGIYKLAFGTLTKQKADISMALLIDMNVPEAGLPGVEVGKTDKSDDLWERITQGVKDVSGAIIGLSILGGVGVAGYYFIKSKDPRNFAKRFY